MSQTACSTTLGPAVYPPVSPSSVDLATQASLQAILNQAPFGRWPDGTPVTAAQYQVAMQGEISASYMPDFQWPFWVGLGLGGVGFVLLLTKRYGKLKG